MSSLSIATFLLLGVYFLILLRRGSTKKKYLQFIIVNCFMEITYVEGGFLKLGNTFVNFKFVALSALAIYTIYFFYRERVLLNFRLTVLLLLFEVVYIPITLYYYLNPPDLLGILNTQAQEHYSLGVGAILIFKSLFWCLSLCIIKSQCSYADILYIVHYSIKYSRVMILYSILEIIVEDIMRAPEIMKFAAEYGWHKQSFEVGDMRGELYQLYGFTGEPSHLCIALFSLGTLMLIYHYALRRQQIFVQEPFRFKFEMALIYCVMILSTGSSGYMYALSLMIITVILKNGIEQVKFKSVIKICSTLLMSAMIVGGAISLLPEDSALGHRIANLDKTYSIIAVYGTNLYETNKDVWNSVNDSSLDRMISIVRGVADFMDSPLWGYGYGQGFSNSSVIISLLDFGALGFVACFFLLGYHARYGVKYGIFIFLLYFFLGGTLAGSRHLGFELVDVMIVEATSLLYCRQSAGKIVLAKY